jgi:hypothetical protein
MSAPNLMPMEPVQTLLAGFVEEYDALRYPDVGMGFFMQNNYLMHDVDLPAAVQVFAEGGQIRAMRLYLDGYFIAPLKQLMMNPALVYQVLGRMVQLEGTAPRARRIRFWLAKRCLDLASWLLAPQREGT